MNKRISWEELGRPRQVVVGQRVEEAKVVVARRMRAEPTPAEARLWEALRGNRLEGFKFRRQQIIDGFIVDFYCHGAALVVECDGAAHDRGYDAERDQALSARHLHVLRFPNERILHDRDAVLQEIVDVARKRAAQQAELPLPERGTSEFGKGVGGIGKTADPHLIHTLTQAAYAEYGSAAGTSTATKETREAVAAQLAGGTEAAALWQGGIALACVRFQPEGDALYFHRLAVHPDHRRQGLASQLLDYLEAEARSRGLTRLTCSVRLQVAGNVALYERRGFVLRGTRSVCRDGTPVPTGDLEKRL